MSATHASHGNNNHGHGDNGHGSNNNNYKIGFLILLGIIIGLMLSNCPGCKEERYIRPTTEVIHVELSTTPVKLNPPGGVVIHYRNATTKYACKNAYQTVYSSGTEDIGPKFKVRPGESSLASADNLEIYVFAQQGHGSVDVVYTSY